MTQKKATRKQLEQALGKLSNIRIELLRIEIITQGEYGAPISHALDTITSLKETILPIVERMIQHESQFKQLEMGNLE